jgi:hypothetical protein
MTINASNLRSNIYKLLDQVLESGQPLTIKRKGKFLKIIPENSPNKLSRLAQHPCMKEKPETYIHCDWSKEWKSDLP